jgi:hypothetical protein
MVKTLKASLTAVMLSSVAVVPFATVAAIVTADAAYAKSEKSKGGEQGRSAEAKSKEKDRGKSGKRGSQKASKGAAKSKSGGLKSVVTANGVIVFHPSQLGNMNGAMNANIKAVLAHIKNGNANGPVGHLAALAVATSNAEGKQAIVDTEIAYQTLEQALIDGGFSSLDDYYDYRNGIDPVTDIDTAKSELDAVLEGGAVETDQEYIDAVQKLEDALGDDFSSYEDYEAARAGYKDTEGFDTSIDDQIAGLGGSSDAENGFDEFAEQRPDGDDYADAVDALEAESAAEGDILDYWNKNPGGEPGEGMTYTDAEQQLLDDLKARFDGNEEAIKSAIASSDTYSSDCDDESEACQGDS